MVAVADKQVEVQLDSFLAGFWLGQVTEDELRRKLYDGLLGSLYRINCQQYARARPVLRLLAVSGKVPNARFTAAIIHSVECKDCRQTPHDNNTELVAVKAIFDEMKEHSELFLELLSP